MTELRQRRPRIKDEAHLAFIRTLPCVITGNTVSVEAAHVRYADPRFAKRQVGMGEKPDDRFVVPLDGAWHRKQHRANEKKWWADMGIDPVLVAVALFLHTGDHLAAETILRTARSAAYR